MRNGAIRHGALQLLQIEKGGFKCHFTVQLYRLFTGHAHLYTLLYTVPSDDSHVTGRTFDKLE